MLDVENRFLRDIYGHLRAFLGRAACSIDSDAFINVIMTGTLRQISLKLTDYRLGVVTAADSLIKEDLYRAESGLPIHLFSNEGSLQRCLKMLG